MVQYFSRQVGGSGLVCSVLWWMLAWLPRPTSVSLWKWLLLLGAPLVCVFSCIIKRNDGHDEWQRICIVAVAEPGAAFVGNVPKKEHVNCDGSIFIIPESIEEAADNFPIFPELLLLLLIEFVESDFWEAQTSHRRGRTGGDIDKHGELLCALESGSHEFNY